GSSACSDGATRGATRSPPRLPRRPRRSSGERSSRIVSSSSLRSRRRGAQRSSGVLYEQRRWGKIPVIFPPSRTRRLSRTLLAPSEYEGSPTRGYLDTATYGLPTRATVAAVEEALASWRARGSWLDWEQDGEACRELFSRIVGA